MITPVWNKSYREHTTIGSLPLSTREAADAAVQGLGWEHAYFVDADHINTGNIESFLSSSDFYTIDVADYIGTPANPEAAEKFRSSAQDFVGVHELAGLSSPIEIKMEHIDQVTDQFLYATQEAGKLFRHIKKNCPLEDLVIEVSMDETERAQSPQELFLILAALAEEKVPVNTLAPKFTGRFNKGVDYVGDVAGFRSEFEADVAVLAFAVEKFGFHPDLKLSIHSGSDKFAIYPIMRDIIRKFDTGLHVKTAGTTWLEELIGLAEAGGEGLAVAKEVYSQSIDRYDELAAPYSTVLDIDKAKLPSKDEVNSWDSDTFARSLRHEQSDSLYNLHFRQLLHVGYKIAAEMGERYLNALETCREDVARNVTENLLERHIKRIFI